MPYTHFQYIAYELPTATMSNGAVVSGFNAGDECASIPEIPVGNYVSDDARIRLKRLAGVINYVKSRARILERHPTTLKIFMAPEFYFRPPSSLGTNYKYNSYPSDIVVEISKTLNQMFVNKDFEDWLIIPGTVVGNTIGMVPKRFYNISFPIQGGVKRKPIPHIEKNLPSGIDGVPVDYAPGHYDKVKAFGSGWEARKEHVFYIDGLAIGLEICLDHLNFPVCRVLKHTVNEWPMHERSSIKLAVHLLTAGGMSVNKESVAARKDGYILRNDGLINKPLPQSNLYQVRNYQQQDLFGNGEIDTYPGNMRGVASLGQDVKISSTIPLPTGPLRAPTKGGVEEKCPQRVVIYERQILK